MFDHFDIIAPFYDRVIHKLDLKRLIHLLKLPTRGRMLDAGGGTGRVSFRLRSLVDEVVVCDLSLFMLKQAKDKGRERPAQGGKDADRLVGEFVVVDGGDHPEKDATADDGNTAPQRQLHRGRQAAGHLLDLLLQLLVERPNLQQQPVLLRHSLLGILDHLADRVLQTLELVSWQLPGVIPGARGQDSL